ncbi:MAG: hypothetical protein WCI49_15845 [Ferruginibacter sp.]
MQSEHYRETIKDALKNLVAVNGQIFNSIVPVAMTGELKEWNDTVPVGEECEFSFDLFKNCKDTNIQLLVQLIEKVEQTFQTMSNINNVNLDEEEISS